MSSLHKRLAILAAVLVLGASGCATTSEGEGSGVGGYLSDAAITTKVKTAIFNEDSLKVTDISVKTEDKVVHLSGTVASRAERAKAIEVARKVSGVKAVKSDLKVEAKKAASK